MVKKLKPRLLILDSKSMELDHPGAAFEDYVTDTLRTGFTQVSFAVDRGIQYAFIVYNQVDDE